LVYTEAVTSPVKERLTGALILIVAVVVIVPELFSGRAQKKPVTEAPDAQAADAGPPLRSYTMELGGAESGGKGGGAQNQVPAPAQPPTASPEVELPPAPQEPTPAAPAPQTPPPAIQPPAPQPTVAKPPAASSSRWWVQLGSFSSRANADRLGETLSKAGYEMQVSPTTTKGKELFRVRAGPVGDREAAVALQTRLAAAGHKGSLVAPQ